jgi:xanthine dehydrogenase accessory factor
VDPRAERDHCFTISDKSLAVGGGVLEAVMSLLPVDLEVRQRSVA